MKDTNQIIQEAVASGSRNYVQDAVNRLLGEDIQSGDEVAVIDDPSYPYQGVKGRVKGPSAKGSGFVDVAMPDGVTVPLQSSLLIKL